MFAWIDSDLQFDTITWQSDTLNLPNGKYDIIQLFSHCNELNKENKSMRTYHPFCHIYFTVRNYMVRNNILITVLIQVLHGE